MSVDNLISARLLIFLNEFEMPGTNVLNAISVKHGIWCILAFTSLLFISAGGINLEEELKITRKEKNAIEELRNLILPNITESYMKDDIQLLKWLRSTRFNVNHARSRMLDDIKWRKTNKISTIMREDFSDIMEDFPIIYTTDKQGEPTLISFAGEWDLRSAVVTGRAQRVLRYMKQVCEECARRIRELQHNGTEITRVNLILDLQAFSIAQHSCFQCLLRIVDFVFIYDNHYPGNLDRIVFINAPPTIAVVMDFTRPVTNAETWKSIKVFTHNKDVWQNYLLSFISPENLPSDLGGTKSRVDFPVSLN